MNAVFPRRGPPPYSACGGLAVGQAARPASSSSRSRPRTTARCSNTLRGRSTSENPTSTGSRPGSGDPDTPAAVRLPRSASSLSPTAPTAPPGARTRGSVVSTAAISVRGFFEDDVGVGAADAERRHPRPPRPTVTRATAAPRSAAAPRPPTSPHAGWARPRAGSAAAPRAASPAPS